MRKKSTDWSAMEKALAKVEAHDKELAETIRRAWMAWRKNRRKRVRL